ncbi:MAG: PAS domain-containing sensor histidine kinase [Verrucomicrobia bacterium]|nr:PAS domain-containing sensor histidine kinase [Verrucomicrobiota bacterium]
MPKQPATPAQMFSEMEDLRARLDEAEQTLRAIRSGEVDALVVEGPEGDQIFTLVGAEHGYRILVETMTEGAVTLRDNGVIYYCNTRLATMLKMPLEKIIGLRLQQFISPPQVSAFKTLLGNSDQERRGEFLFVASDGMAWPVLVSMTPLPGEAAGTVCAVLTDLRQQKHAETLEKMVLLRTTQLREKIGELEAFSYSLSHDMRQPLRAMQGFSQILLNDYSECMAPEPKDFILRIKTAANRLDRLIDDVLTYSHATCGENELTAISLSAIVREVVQCYQNLRKAEIEIAPGIALVLGYEVGLTQCISNLLTNAVKFVPAGKTPKIKIWWELRGEFVRLWIQDNGIGIAPRDQKTIFEMFSRVYSNEDYEGTGIGLSIVAKSVEKMGGQLGVESELGKGSCFWIDLQKVIVTGEA